MRDILIYKISVSLEEKCMLKSARAFIVFKNLEDAGEVIFSNPSSDDIESESFEGKFTVLFMTKESIDEIKPSVESVSEVETVEISNFDIDILETLSKNCYPSAVIHATAPSYCSKISLTRD